MTRMDDSLQGATGKLPARIDTPDGQGRFPMVVDVHGGGRVIVDEQVHDGGARGIAKEADAVVISVDHQRAPEAEFPAARDDALASCEWALADASQHKGGPKRVALAGEDADGNLAVAAAVVPDAKEAQACAGQRLKGAFGS